MLSLFYQLDYHSSWKWRVQWFIMWPIKLHQLLGPVYNESTSGLKIMGENPGTWGYRVILGNKTILISGNLSFISLYNLFSLEHSGIYNLFGNNLTVSRIKLRQHNLPLRSILLKLITKCQNKYPVLLNWWAYIYANNLLIENLQWLVANHIDTDKIFWKQKTSRKIIDR